MLSINRYFPEALANRYQRDGFVSPVDILGHAEVAAHCRCLEQGERRFGSLHYVSKVHTIFSQAARLATDPRVLDVVESLLGPDILLFDVTYIIKEPRSSAYVSWHQDLTYWGFAGDSQVSMWLALSDSSVEAGCMRMIPGSHRGGAYLHQDRKDRDNVLHRGQTVMEVAEDGVVSCPLVPGQASFHHGWTLHASSPNNSVHRRIGLNVQYITPDMRQLVNPHETALLVRGQDRFDYFDVDVLAYDDFAADAVARHARLERLRKETWDRAG